jgi:hypothetical protein
MMFGHDGTRTQIIGYLNLSGSKTSNYILVFIFYDRIRNRPKYKNRIVGHDRMPTPNGNGLGGGCVLQVPLDAEEWFVDGKKHARQWAEFLFGRTTNSIHRPRQRPSNLSLSDEPGPKVLLHEPPDRTTWRGLWFQCTFEPGLKGWAFSPNVQFRFYCKEAHRNQN